MKETFKLELNSTQIGTIFNTLGNKLLHGNPDAGQREKLLATIDAIDAQADMDYGTLIRNLLESYQSDEKIDEFFEKLKEKIPLWPRTYTDVAFQGGLWHSTKSSVGTKHTRDPYISRCERWYVTPATHTLKETDLLCDCWIEDER